jgi:colicin import membrane protein
VQAISGKIRSNLYLPPNTPADIQANFAVVQLPSGEVIDIKLISSSGFLAYDSAVKQAIIKSSPLPRPSDPSLFERVLRLTFIPCDPQNPATIARQGKCS